VFGKAAGGPLSKEAPGFHLEGGDVVLAKKELGAGGK
jgi:hypothetical protein